MFTVGDKYSSTLHDALPVPHIPRCMGLWDHNGNAYKLLDLHTQLVQLLPWWEQTKENCLALTFSWNSTVYHPRFQVSEHAGRKLLQNCYIAFFSITWDQCHCTFTQKFHYKSKAKQYQQKCISMMFTHHNQRQESSVQLILQLGIHMISKHHAFTC